MHSRQGIISKAVIESVRRALHNKYVEDSQIKNMLEEFLAEDLTPQELEITGHAYKEVKDRLAYSAVLDGLWQEIDETQALYDTLHVYDSLEKEYSSAKTRLDHEDLPIDSVDLEEVNMDDESNGHDGDRSLVAREKGTVMARGNQSLAERHDGAMVMRNSGSVAVRPLQNIDVIRNMPLFGKDLPFYNNADDLTETIDVLANENEDVAESEGKKHKKGKCKSKRKGEARQGEGCKSEGRKGKKCKKGKHEPRVEPLDFDALEAAAEAAKEAGLYESGASESRISDSGVSASDLSDNLAHEAGNMHDTDNMHDGASKKSYKHEGHGKGKCAKGEGQFRKKGKAKSQAAQDVESKDGELFLKDILTLLGKDGQPADSWEELIRNTEWKEFKQLTKRAKKALKRARKTAKQMAFADFDEHYGVYRSDMRDPEEPVKTANEATEAVTKQGEVEETVHFNESQEDATLKNVQPEHANEPYDAETTVEASADTQEVVEEKTVEEPVVTEKKHKKDSGKQKKHTKSKR